MGERVKQVTDKVKEFTGKMSRGVKAAILIVLVLAVAALVALAVYRSNRPYVTLFRELSTEDMTAVMTYLNDNNITDFQVQGNNTILVRENMKAPLTAAIYQQGYPTSGFAYRTYLDNVGMLASESDREALQLYELMDRLSATVQLFDGVREAHVNITQGTDHSYILGDNVTEATASVFVTMQTGQTLTSQQVTAIRNMITHSVQGLSFSDVTISDGAGNTYSSGGGDSADVSDLASLKLVLESQVNDTIRTSVMNVLAPLFGSENVSISVNSTVNVSRSFEEATTYNLPAWAENGQGIIGSRVWANALVRGENGNAGGVAGTTTNADLNEYVINQGQLDGTEQEVSTSGEVQYDNSYTTTQREDLGGTVEDLMVAVVINSSGTNVPNMNTLVPLVARAARIDTRDEADKIAIMVYPFFEREETAEPGDTENEGLFLNLPRWALYAAIAGIALFLILLIVVLVLRNRAKKKREEREREEAERLLLEQQEREQLAAEAAAEAAEGEEKPEQGADIMELHSERSMELRRDVRQFVEENPAIAAQMLKQWLRGEDEIA